ncbi:MAG TPA: cytochrome D1 domain-containing protein [Terriglobia bacterium]|nr:cytochrome D1 domain-containing protein [Terriglobia bacterium]
MLPGLITGRLEALMILFKASSVLLMAGTLGFPLLAAGPSGRTPARATSRGLLLVDNKGNHMLSIVDPETGREVATVTETGITGHEVAASPDGRTAYVPLYGNSGVGSPGTDGRTIDVVDLATRRVVSTIDLGRPMRPHCPNFGPKDGLLYVTTELADSVTVIDPKNNKIVGSIPTGQPESHMLAITHDGRRIYTANVGPGTVSVLDIASRKTLAVVHIAKVVQRISISTDDRYAFTSDETQPRLAVIDTATNKVTRWVELPGIGYGASPTLDSRYLLVAVINKNQVAVVDLKAMKVVRTIAVPAAPQEVLVRPDDRVAYVSCDRSRQVAAINLHTWKVDKLINTGPATDGLAWATAQ